MVTSRARSLVRLALAQRERARFVELEILYFFRVAILRTSPNWYLYCFSDCMKLNQTSKANSDFSRGHKKAKNCFGRR